MDIVPLAKCTDDINNFLHMNQDNKEYENLYMDNWFRETTDEISNWSRTGFGFYDENMLIGWIDIEINRPTEAIDIRSFCIINKRKSLNIMRWTMQMIESKVTKRTPKVVLQTMVGSKAESIWKKLTKKYNGRIVGIKKNECTDQSGNMRDIIMFEILNDEFVG